MSSRISTARRACGTLERFLELADMRLSDEQLEQYQRDGFVNAGRVFTPTTIASIENEYDRLVNCDAQVLGNTRDGVFPYRAMLNFRSTPLAECVVEPELLELAAQLLGSDIRFWWDQGINKAPGAGSAIAWHQDNGYTQGRISEYLTCWLALDDSDLDNGGLQVLPGSHRLGQREHEWQGVHAVIPEVAGEHAVALDARAGDLLLFSSLLIHQTVGNSSRDRNRRAWVIQYCRADQCNEVTGEIYDNRPWVMRDGVPLKSLQAERRFDLADDRP
jgi:phytanoyl-CoA hydroxylase